MNKFLVISAIALTTFSALCAGTKKFGKMRDSDWVVTNAWQAMQHRVKPDSEWATNHFGSAEFSNAVARVQVHGAGGGIDTNAVDALANSAVVTNALTVATTNRVALLESSKADNSALEGKVSWDSEHLGVSLGNGYLYAGPYSSLGSDSTIGPRVAIGDNALIGNTSGGSTFIGGWLHFSPERKLFSPALFAGGDQLIYTTDFGFNVLLYFPSKSGTIATTDDITHSISETNTVFSNAVLAVNVDFATNTTGAAYVAVTNALAGFGFDADALAELPGGKVYGSVGGLLAALAAAAAWLKKNKVQTLKLNDNSVETSADGGVAKLDDFFTELNSLLTGTIDARLPYPLYAVPSTGVLKDRAINTTSLDTVTVPDNFTDLLIRATVASSLAVTMPAAITKYGDTFPGEAGEYLITITKTGAAEAYVRTIKLEEVA